MRRLLTVLLAFLSAGLCVAQTRTFSVGTGENTKGFANMVEEVLRDAGLNPVTAVYPKARLTLMLKEGTIDGAFFLSEENLEVAQGSVAVPIALYFNDIVAVTVDPLVTVATPADLKKYEVGVERGNVNHKAVLAGAMAAAETVDANAQGKMLASKRVQVVLLPRVLVPGVMKSAGIAVWYVQEPALLRIPLFFGLSPKAGDKQKILTEVFKKVIDNGSWSKKLATVIQTEGVE